jgi:competence protein ComEA
MVDEAHPELPPLLPPSPDRPPDLVAALRAAVAEWVAVRRLSFRPGRSLIVVGLVLVLGVGAWALLVRSPPPPVDEQLPRGVPPGITTGSPGPAGAAGATGGSGASGVPGSAVTPTTVVATLVIDVGGAVARPGLVRVDRGARVADVVAAAGGATHDADLDRLNLAATVADGERLFVPHLGQASIPVAVNGDGGGGGGAPAPGSPGSSGAAPVDLNSATAEQLDTLPGVGPATAAAIVAYRTQHGPFRTVDDLLQVHGIGPAKLAALRSKVRV